MPRTSRVLPSSTAIDRAIEVMSTPESAQYCINAFADQIRGARQANNPDVVVMLASMADRLQGILMAPEPGAAYTGTFRGIDAEKKALQGDPSLHILQGETPAETKETTKTQPEAREPEVAPEAEKPRTP